MSYREPIITDSNAHAVVLLPTTLSGSSDAARAARWLSRGRVTQSAVRQHPLYRIADALGLDKPEGGLAALRLWAQTGERSTQWVAAADPVHLQTRLHHLRVSAFRADEIPLADLREIYGDLQSLFAANAGFGLARVGAGGYLRGAQPLATSDVPPALAHGGLPDEFALHGADPDQHHRLLGEVQLLLHEHAVNRRREEAGLRSINSLWFWGGGVAPAPQKRAMPKLFSDDPVVQGYWLSMGASGEHWGASLEEYLHGGSVVAMPPPSAALSVDESLNHIGKALRSGDLDVATIGLANGITVELRRRDLYRIWRGPSSLFTTAVGNE